MTKHTCKHCNRIFEYCRGCLLSPIPHKDAGFCSKECYEASKIQVVPTVEIEPIVEEVITEKVVETVFVDDTTQTNDEVSVEVEVNSIVEEEMSLGVDVEAVAFAKTPIVETTKVAEPTIKKETNTYKKKKNKYR